MKKSKKLMRPTQLVALAMDNDEEDYKHFWSLAKDLAANHDYDEAIPMFAKVVKTWVDESTPSLHGLPLDLMQYVNSIIDYHEIAAHWIIEAKIDSE